MSGAGSTFGTHSPPLSDPEPLGVCNIRGDKAPGVPDSKQREAYFLGSQSEHNTAADAQSHLKVTSRQLFVTPFDPESATAITCNAGPDRQYESASGLLGSAVYDAFKKSDAKHTVLGLAHTRSTDELKKVDLLDFEATERVFSEFKPDYYVFDGASPPYPPSAPTNPINSYGRSKRDGELAVLGVSGVKAVVLRVPVLYGPTPNNADSAINLLFDIVSDQSGKTYKMDHYATRYPTNVLDIADFLVRLASLPSRKPLPPIIHYSAEEPFTKYEICLVFAKLLGLPHTHIVPQSDEPKDAATRPRDAHLYTHETEDLMADAGGLGWTPFEEWWTGYLNRSQC
ncbi:hypothetical protein NM688_g8428 [Phlebia brevispora]|uniref:Uncharacterized protein n=1 Tax=Phlebia brevispora TaxID=194682 RepID=A0ACC1RUE3_9APHY|nr:hypothetical protein NM688_g8428 [Phlebia brevispora]